MVLGPMLSAATTLIPLVVGMILWNRINTPAKIIVVYCLWSAISDSIGISLALRNQNNAVVINLFSLGQLIILVVYFTQFLASKRARSFAYAGLLALLLFLLYYGYILHSPCNHVSALRILGLSSLALIALSLQYFYDTLKKLQFERIESNPYFWIASGILLHLTSCVTLALLPEFVSSNEFVLLWFYFKNIMQGLMNILFVIGIVLAYRNGPISERT